MPQLYMDTDQVRSTLSGIHAVHGQMIEQVQGLMQEIDYLVGVAWQAPGAAQYGNEFARCQEILMYLLGELEGLIIDVNREVAEWEEAGSTFARSASAGSPSAYTPRYFLPFG